jgi:cbb3-type cytochrome oxidase subunit 3
MNMVLEVIHMAWTVLLLIAFVGIVAWAWSARSQNRFEIAARSLLDDDATTLVPAVIPAKAGIQRLPLKETSLDSGVRRNDDKGQSQHPLPGDTEGNRHG